MGKVIAARMTNQLDRHGTCVGKATYASGALAARIARKSKYAGTAPYRCPFCGGFHIGGRPPSAKPGKLARMRKRS